MPTYFFGDNKNYRYISGLQNARLSHDPLDDITNIHLLIRILFGESLNFLKCYISQEG